MLKLYYSPGTCSLASHIALEETGAAYEAVRIDTKAGDQHRPDYLEINPKRRVPALATDRGVLTESPAILAWIAESFPDAQLAPIGDSFAFARMQAFNVYLTSSVHVTFAHAFRSARYADDDAAQAAMKAKVPQALDEQFALIETQLADGRPFVHGETYTVSDPYLFVFSGWLQNRGYGSPDKFPNVRRHWQAIGERPAVKRVLAREAA